MRLVELEPQFYRFRIDSDGVRLPRVETLAEAQGIRFLCPLHFAENGGPVGTHSVLVWFDGRGVDPNAEPTARWRVSGSGFEDLTISPSINPNVPPDPNFCKWHGWVTGGEVT